MWCIFIQESWRGDVLNRHTLRTCRAPACELLSNDFCLPNRWCIGWLCRLAVLGCESREVTTAACVCTGPMHGWPGAWIVQLLCIIRNLNQTMETSLWTLQKSPCFWKFMQIWQMCMGALTTIFWFGKCVRGQSWLFSGHKCEKMPPDYFVIWTLQQLHIPPP